MDFQVLCPSVPQNLVWAPNVLGLSNSWQNYYNSPTHDKTITTMHTNIWPPHSRRKHIWQLSTIH